MGDLFGDSGLNDEWVLICLFAAWCMLIIPFLWSIRTGRSSKEYTLNAAGILVRTALLGKLPDGQDLQFILQDALPKNRASVWSQEGGAKPGMHRVRCFADFCAGIVPPPAGTSFQTNYRTSSRGMVYKLLHTGAMPMVAHFLCIVGTIAVTFTWTLRNDLEAAGFTSVFSPEVIAGNIKAAFEVQSVLLPFSSFLLALYINIKLTWFMSIVDLAWSIQTHIHNIALNLGSSLIPYDDPGHLKTKFVVYRYLNLMHFLLYRSIAVEYERVTIEDLCRCGFVLGQEQAYLEESPHPRNLVTLWLSSLFQQLKNEEKIDGKCRMQLIELVMALRSDCDNMVKELTRMYPVSFAQLLQLMIDILLILTPASLSHALHTDRTGVTVYLWPAFGSMVTALFYQGGMRLITAMEYPFGVDVDDLHPQWVLMSTELHVFGYLNPQTPAGLPGCDEEEEPMVYARSRSSFTTSHSMVTRQGSLPQSFVQREQATETPESPRAVPMVDVAGVPTESLSAAPTSEVLPAGSAQFSQSEAETWASVLPNGISDNQ